MDKIIVRTPEDAMVVLKRWTNKRQEHFLAITLDGGHRVIKFHHISKGTLNRTIVHPRECFYPAIKDYAGSIIFAHNHPSGNTGPSGEDDETTDRLLMAGAILGIYVLDHIILSKNGDYYSYRQKGGLKSYFHPEMTERFIRGIAAESYCYNKEGPPDVFTKNQERVGTLR